MRLRTKFFVALALLTSIPLLILLFGVVDRLESEIKARTENVLHATLDKMAGELDVLLRSQRSIAVGLARVPAVWRFAATAAGNDRREYESRAEELGSFFLNYQRAVPSIQGLRFIDTHGKTLVKVKEGKPIEPGQRDPGTGRYFVADQSYKAFFRRAISGGREVSMSDFELGQVTPGADFCPSMVRYSVLIKDELDTVEGLLVVNMWGERLDRTVEASLGGYPGKVYIVELHPGSPRDGIFLYHPDAKMRFADQLGSNYRLTAQLTSAEWQEIRDAAEFGSLYRNDGRMLFFRKFAPFEDRPTQWLLVIETASSTVLAPINSMRQSIWLLLGVIVLLSLLVAVWAAVRLTRPVQRLAALITRYADGDGTARYREERSDEVGLAGRAFNYLADGLERAQHDRDKAEEAVRQSERLAAVGQLAAGIGHEINNPLMNIMALASLIEQELHKRRDEQTLSDINLLQREGRRCARIVQGILNFARENSPSYQSFDMIGLINDTLGLLQHRLDTADISITVDVPASLWMEGDPNQLQQVLVNVLLNAIHASPSQSTIALRVVANDGRVTIEVKDQGTGIAEEHIDRVFNPFFTTKVEGDGTGLGLSVSYGIVKHHGGTIRLSNAPGGGVNVVINLPMHSREAQCTQRKQREQRERVHAG